MGIRVIDDTTGLELKADDATSFGASIQIVVYPIGQTVYGQALPPIYISKAGIEDVLDNPQWQQIYEIFLKMLPTVTMAWETMVADIKKMVVTDALGDISPILKQ